MEPILRDFLGNDGSAMAGRQLLNFQQLEGFGLRRRTAELFHHQRPRLSFDGRDQDEVGETLKVRSSAPMCHLWQPIMLRRLPAP